MAKSNIILRILCIAFTMGFGLLGGLVTAPQIKTWYVFLQKPSFNPPNYLFGPVWSLLYLLMGIALYKILVQPASSLKQQALVLFFIQYLLNFCWSFIFFKYHAIGVALIEIILMWLFILCTIIQFAKLNKTAAWLFVPYIAWVSFATLLNWRIYVLN